MGNERELNRVVELLEDIRALMHISAKEKIDQIRAQAFDDPKQIEAYKLLDGTTSLRKIARKVGVTHPTVGRWLEGWRTLGLVDPKENARTLSPDVLGI